MITTEDKDDIVITTTYFDDIVITTDDYDGIDCYNDRRLNIRL